MDINIGAKKIYSKETPNKELAWALKDSEAVLEYMYSNKQLVLGGDILNSEFEYTYDNWFYNKDKSKSNEENSKQSVKFAIQYIVKYMEENGNNYYVIFVVE